MSWRQHLRDKFLPKGIYFLNETASPHIDDVKVLIFIENTASDPPPGDKELVRFTNLKHLVDLLFQNNLRLIN
jgi:hypothetical protein